MWRRRERGGEHEPANIKAAVSLMTSNSLLSSSRHNDINDSSALPSLYITRLASVMTSAQKRLTHNQFLTFAKWHFPKIFCQFLPSRKVRFKSHSWAPRWKVHHNWTYDIDGDSARGKSRIERFDGGCCERGH